MSPNATKIKRLSEVLVQGEPLPPVGWDIRAVESEECISYVAWNRDAREALVIDPKREDFEAYRSIARELDDYVWLGVIDTHTHADHVSAAASLADELKAPLVMHEKAPSRRVSLRSAERSLLASRAAPVQLVPTPGHTQDSITVLWGPFLFGGDTVLYRDSGRDDLPGGDPEAHYESLQALKARARPDMLVLPGHDREGGRVSSWGTQLRESPSLTQDKTEFVRESRAFDVPAPRLLKESLYENFK